MKGGLVQGLVLTQRVVAGSPDLCHAVWTKPQLQDGPILAALAESRTFFPAFSVPLVSLLESLIADARSAHAAAAYFGNISHVTTLNHVEDTDLEVVKGSNSVVAVRGFAIPGVPWLVIKPVRTSKSRVQPLHMSSVSHSFFPLSDMMAWLLQCFVCTRFRCDPIVVRVLSVRRDGGHVKTYEKKK